MKVLETKGTSQSDASCVSQRISNLRIEFARYEKADFQQKVLYCYDKLYDGSYWQKVDADRSVNELTDVLKQYAEETIQAVTNEPMARLW